jgi:hypothetical protein
MGTTFSCMEGCWWWCGDELDEKETRLPTAFEVRILLPLIEHDFKKRNGIKRHTNKLGRMKRAFGGDEKSYEFNMLRDHARYNCNTPAVFETDTLNGLYWPGLCTTPWVDSLPWTRELRGKKVVAPLIQELKKIISSANNSIQSQVPLPSSSSSSSSCLTSCLYGRSTEVEDASIASREGNKAVLKPYNEGHGHDTLVRENNKWRTLFLIDNGRENESVCQSCPEIMKLVRRIPKRCSDVFISAISPGAKIRLHRGPTNTKLTCHLGLIVPSGDLGLKVGTETRTWSVGEWILFNDSYPHEAWNHGSGVRYVLIVDVWCPGLTDEEVRALEILRRDRVKLFHELRRREACCCFRASGDIDDDCDQIEEETSTSSSKICDENTGIVMSPVTTTTTK